MKINNNKKETQFLSTNVNINLIIPSAKWELIVTIHGNYLKESIKKIR